MGVDMKSKANGVALSTLQLAREIGVHRATILRWLQSGLLPEPRHVRTPNQDIRIWGARDIERARRLKEAHGWAERREKARRRRELDEHRQRRRKP
jgi:hypothetical protein